MNRPHPARIFPASELTLPVVQRISSGAEYGAQPHIPGLRVVYPVAPYDTKGIRNSAPAGTDPVLFLEGQRVYGFGAMFVESGVPEEYDLGPELYTTVQAADKLAGRFGMSAEIIDLRSADPLNYQPLADSIRKT